MVERIEISPKSPLTPEGRTLSLLQHCPFRGLGGFLFFWLACFGFCFAQIEDNKEPKEEVKEDKTDYWQLSLEKLKTSNYGDALNALNKVLEKNRNNSLAYLKRGFAKRKLGNPSSAEEDYTNALSLNANLTEAYLGRAQARVRLGFYERAIDDYSQTLTRQPMHPRMKEILYNRGLAYMKLKNYKEAIKDFRETVKMDSDFAKAWVNLGFIYYFSGEIRKACSDWLRARDLKNESAKRNTQRACQCCM